MTPTNRSLNGTSANITIDKVRGIFWCTSFGIVGFLIFSSNLATIATFGVNNHLRRRGIYCLLNLAIADMLLGAFSIPYYVNDIAVLFLQWNLLEPQVYVVVRGTYITVLFASLFSLLIVSLNRVYATYLPFRYRTMKIRSHLSVFAIVWALATAASVVFFLLKGLQDQVVLVFQGLFVMALIIITMSYMVILIKMKMNNKDHFPTTFPQTRERQLAVTVFMVSLLSMATWIPSIVFHAVYKTQTSGFNIDLQLAIYLIHSTNSLINPIIYVFKMRDFRKALCKLFTTCVADNSIAPPTSPDKVESNNSQEHARTNKIVLSFDNIICDTRL